MHRACKHLRSVTTLSVKRIRRKFVDIESEGNGIAIVALSNAERRNCVNVQLLEELNYVLTDLSEKWNLRSVLLKSKVPGMFSTGTATLFEYFFSHKAC